MKQNDCKVDVTKEDREKLQKCCSEIMEILEKYPASNNLSNYYVTAMARAKNSFDDFNMWINCLGVVN